MPKDLSSVVPTAFSIGAQKLGQPVRQSYLVSAENRSSAQPAQANVPFRFSCSNGLLNGRSVPDRRPPSEAVTKSREDDFLYLWLFPNFMLNVSPDYAQTNVVVPTGPESCEVVFDYWFPVGASEEARARREESIRWSDGIQREDIQLCEDVQRNLRSRAYRAGRYSARRENGVHHFHERLRTMLARSRPDEGA